MKKNKNKKIVMPVGLRTICMSTLVEIQRQADYKTNVPVVSDFTNQEVTRLEAAIMAAYTGYIARIKKICK